MNSDGFEAGGATDENAQLPQGALLLSRAVTENGLGLCAGLTCERVNLRTFRIRRF